MRILFALLISISAFGQDIMIRPSDWNIQAAKYGVKPGSRLILTGDRKEIEFHDMIGTADQPIIVTALSKINIGAVNPGGRVVQFSNCQYVRLTGDPTGIGAVNIFINGGGQAIDFRDLSLHIEIDHNDIITGYSGINVKTDPTCDPKTWRGNFILDGVYIHDNRITTATGEGMYIGESHYNTVGAIQGGPCTSGATTAQEHEVRNVIIENNVITASGADGIQIGACPSGAIIRYNQVTNFGTVDGYGQNAGIIINPGTVAEIYGNTINTGTGFAIQLQGPGGSYVHNNFVTNAGIGKGAGAGAVFAAVYPIVGLPAQADYVIANNTFLNITKEGIEYYNPVTWRDNILDMKTGVFSKQGGNLGKLNKSGNNVEVFGDPAQLKLDVNYYPTSASPAWGTTTDAGAFQTIKVQRYSGATWEASDSLGILKAWLITGDGKKIRIK